MGRRSLPRKCWATFTSTADCTEAVSASRNTRLGSWPVVPLEVSTLSTSDSGMLPLRWRSPPCR